MLLVLEVRLVGHVLLINWVSSVVSLRSVLDILLVLENEWIHCAMLRVI